MLQHQCGQGIYHMVDNCKALDVQGNKEIDTEKQNKTKKTNIGTNGNEC